MKNKVIVSSDGINVYTTIHSKAGKVGIVLLGLCIVCLISLHIFLFRFIVLNEEHALVLPAIFIIAVTLWFPTKYFLWNLFGKEDLIINSKSVSWSYDYGFFQIPLKTISIDEIGFTFEEINIEKDEKLGEIHVFNYKKENNLPEFIHKTTLTLTEKEYKNIVSEFDEILRKEFETKNNFIGFSAN